MNIDDFLKDNFVPKKSLIHDCVRVVSVDTLTADVTIQLPITTLSYEYTSVSGRTLYTPATANIKDSIDNAVVPFNIMLELYGAKDQEIELEGIIPHPSGDISVGKHSLYLNKNNEFDHYYCGNWFYNGVESEATIYGVDIKLTPIGANVDIREGSIKCYVP